MTERERLAEMIQSAMYWGYTTPSEIAERLIDEGVICTKKISDCCKGGRRYTCGGYHWRYASREEAEAALAERRGT